MEEKEKTTITTKVIKDPTSIAEALLFPKDAEFIAWAKQAPKRCLIVSDDSARMEGFASPLEEIAWLRHVLAEKQELLAQFTENALKEWERETGLKIPAQRRKA